MYMYVYIYINFTMGVGAHIPTYEGLNPTLISLHNH